MRCIIGICFWNFKKCPGMRYKKKWFCTCWFRGDYMIDNEELPIGFTMELAQHSDILNAFSKLDKERQQSYIDGARNVKTRDEMRSYVERMRF